MKVVTRVNLAAASFAWLVFTAIVMAEMIGRKGISDWVFARATFFLLIIAFVFARLALLYLREGEPNVEPSAEPRIVPEGGAKVESSHPKA